jgi:histidine kinase-like protein
VPGGRATPGMSAWVRRSCLEVRPIPAALPRVRRYARRTLGEWKLGYLADDVELVISELATNAMWASQPPAPAAPGVRAGRQGDPGVRAGAPVMAVYLAMERDQLVALVWDSCLEPPVRRAHDDDAEAGRGLELVQALSDGWGSCAAEPGGKSSGRGST